MKLTATVVYSVGMELNLPDDATEEQQREAILNEAMKSEIDFRHPIIHECSNEDLIG